MLCYRNESRAVPQCIDFHTRWCVNSMTNEDYPKGAVSVGTVAKLAPGTAGTRAEGVRRERNRLLRAPQQHPRVAILEDVSRSHGRRLHRTSADASLQGPRGEFQSSNHAWNSGLLP